ncbi:MAG: lysophospholipid acyltransferase family protein [Rhodobacteraceae bacterium]|nr:lysophospholipid acyltransferase family protein [Paracoccaceae bacterium]
MGVSNTQSFTWQNWISDSIARGVIGLACALPYDRRVPITGWFMRRVAGPISGAKSRALANLAHVWPDLPPGRAGRIADAAIDNFGRMLIENYSTAELLARAKGWVPLGPGVPALARAKAAGRPVLLISGHFGNYEAARAALTVRGYTIGGLYRPMNNGYFNRHYVAAMERLGGPVFPRGTRGMVQFVRYLKSGGHGVVLIDQYTAGGVQLDFLGQPAPTGLAVAAMALKYDAVLIPFYAERMANGLDFNVTLEAPIPASDAETMTQALNDSLAHRVRTRPEQWFWVHRRWKPWRQARFVSHQR